MFQEYYIQLQLPNNIDYFKTLMNFIINNNCIIHNSKLYHQESGTAQGRCLSNMLADLFLYHYEKHFTTTNNFHLYRYIGDIILFSANHSNFLLLIKYPSYLNLTKNIMSNNSINFLFLKLF